jgi:hypothetical protein
VRVWRTNFQFNPNGQCAPCNVLFALVEEVNGDVQIPNLGAVFLAIAIVYGSGLFDY